MEILVLVEEYSYWYSFLRDLKDLWEYKVIRPDRVAIGNITYQLVVGDSDRWHGLRPERVYVYHYTHSKTTKKTGVSSMLRPIQYFEIHGVEIVYIETDWGYV